MTPTHLILLAQSHPEIPPSFVEWLRDNLDIYARFEIEAIRIAESGRDHYSAYTIKEYIRHETLLQDSESEFKINNNITPSLARLFALANPKYAGLFSYRSVAEEAA